MNNKTTKNSHLKRTEVERTAAIDAMLERERSPTHRRNLSAVQDLDELIDKAKKRDKESIEDVSDDSSDSDSEIEAGFEVDALEEHRKKMRGDFTDSNTAQPTVHSASPAQTPTTPAPVVTASEDMPDTERRLALLRSLGGTAKYSCGEWKFTGIGALVASEKDSGRKRSSEKTIRADLNEAAQAERDAKAAGFATGLGQR